MRKAVFLDRDGVLNKTVLRDGKPRAPYTLEEFQLFSGVQAATEQLKLAGYLLIVVTNQPDIARGWVNRESVDLINEKIRELLVVDDIKICFHINSDQCDCRKPRPGMLLEASLEWEISLKDSYMIGDRYSDVAAGAVAGCHTILIGPGDQRGDFSSPDSCFESLLEASQWILN